MNKIFIFVIAFAFIASVSAIGGVKDWAGNYYDLTTGQYSSSLTGRVYNSYASPAVVHASPYVAAPYVSAYAAAPYASYGYGYAGHPLAYNRLLLK